MQTWIMQYTKIHQITLWLRCQISALFTRTEHRYDNRFIGYCCKSLAEHCLLVSTLKWLVRSVAHCHRSGDFIGHSPVDLTDMCTLANYTRTHAQRTHRNTWLILTTAQSVSILRMHSIDVATLFLFHTNANLRNLSNDSNKCTDLFVCANVSWHECDVYLPMCELCSNIVC